MDENKRRMSELLVETGAYKDLDRPVILTSGELGIYYVNTEKLAQDNGEFEKYGEDSGAMFNHAVKMMEARPTFKEVIEIIADEVKPLTTGHDFAQISGGQRRDWLFSGPVAYVLGLPHISLYKQPLSQGFEILTCGGSRVLPKYSKDLSDVKAIHIADLLTEASSCCKEPNGWIPQLRSGGADITDLFAVTTRLQGGEQNLDKLGVKTHTFVAIDEDFLGAYSKNPGRACAYHSDPKAWSEAYLRAEGALALVGAFDPLGGKLDRAKKFMARYEQVLRATGKMPELENVVQAKYGQPLSAILGDK